MGRSEMRGGHACEIAARLPIGRENNWPRRIFFLKADAMGTKDRRVDAYIDKAQPFARPILKHLRKIVHTACPDLAETIKWSMPHFDYKGGILCAMAAFKQHCAFHFKNGELVFGSRAKEDEAMGQFGRITSIADLPNEKVLIGYVRKAAELKEMGIKPPAEKKTKRKPLPVPPYLADALKKNTKARKTFENFSPSNQRDYIEWLTKAKRNETRRERLQTAIEWITQGKPRNWKYTR
jgi:uncharacterized protein YdeI (YjbR/CyaY-like superfamily)